MQNAAVTVKKLARRPVQHRSTERAACMGRNSIHVPRTKTIYYYAKKSRPDLPYPRVGFALPESIQVGRCPPPLSFSSMFSSLIAYSTLMYPKTMTSTITEKVSRTEGLTWFQRLVRRFKPASSESGPEYSSLVDDDEESSIASGEERRPKEKETKGGWQWLKAVALLRYPLYISIVIHSFILADLVWAHWFGRVTFGEYGKGFNTDFGKLPDCDTHRLCLLILAM
jgi:hypothetical protein